MSDYMKIHRLGKSGKTWFVHWARIPIDNGFDAGAHHHMQKTARRGAAAKRHRPGRGCHPRSNSDRLEVRA